jgi:dihydroorotate dehydrogenase
MGFNNGGLAAALAAALRTRATRNGIVGVNVGANKDSTWIAWRITCTGVRTMNPVADYLTVNISSPNTPGLRALQDAGALTANCWKRSWTCGPWHGDPPVFLKVAPDLDDRRYRRYRADRGRRRGSRG